MLWKFLIMIAEKFCANELLGYLERYHAERKAVDIANAPKTKHELIKSFD